MLTPGHKLWIGYHRTELHLPFSEVNAEQTSAVPSRRLGGAAQSGEASYSRSNEASADVSGTFIMRVSKGLPLGLLESRGQCYFLPVFV